MSRLASDERLVHATLVEVVVAQVRHLAELHSLLIRIPDRLHQFVQKHTFF